jgi:imidazolonepropionase-like amidohydrolase
VVGVVNAGGISWRVRAVPLPEGDGAEECWVDPSGCLTGTPQAGAEDLPGAYVCHGLVDAHAHPSVGPGSGGPVALSPTGTVNTLAEWASTGVTAIRDVGSPGGLTLDLHTGPELPSIQAAGRFLAPADQYFPELLLDGVPEDQLVRLALAEVARGASWVKVIADFPKVSDGVPSGSPRPTYRLPVIAELVGAVHTAGARVAVHSTIGNVAELVSVGVDSIEHGTSIDEPALELMAQTGAAWVPTLSAVFGPPDAGLPPDRRKQRAEFRERLATLLPVALTLGVPVLTGSDGVGTVAGEIMWLAAYGFTASQAVAAATTAAYRFLELDVEAKSRPTSLVTYDNDPRDDPAELANPRAVLIRGHRVR